MNYCTKSSRIFQYKFKLIRLYLSPCLGWFTPQIPDVAEARMNTDVTRQFEKFCKRLHTTYTRHIHRRDGGHVHTHELTTVAGLAIT